MEENTTREFRAQAEELARHAKLAEDDARLLDLYARRHGVEDEDGDDEQFPSGSDRTE